MCSKVVLYIMVSGKAIIDTDKVNRPGKMVQAMRGNGRRIKPKELENLPLQTVILTKVNG